MRILVLHDTPNDFEAWLQERLPQDSIDFASDSDAVSRKLREQEPEVVFSIKHSQFPGEAHRPALEYPSVSWFQVGGSGTDHLGDWDPDKVVVTNCAGVLAEFHAERSMAGLLALSTGLIQSFKEQEAKSWTPTRFATLQGKTLLIVGLGATGKALARRAKAFGMKVVGVKRRVEACPEADTVHAFSELASLWSEADVVSFNVPLTASTTKLLDGASISQLPRGAIVLNGARGGVICQDSLVGALKSGLLGGAWLDVTSPEPLPQDSPLWDHPRVIITPHSADQVEDFPLRFAHFFADNVDRYRAGQDLKNLVIPIDTGC